MPRGQSRPPGPPTPAMGSPIGGARDPIAPPDPFPNLQPPSEVPPQAPPPKATPQAELSPEEQVMFASLLTCGRRSKTLTILDHTVVVQTLCCDDDMRIGLYVKDYQNTLGESRAYQVAVAAAGLRSIDGSPLVQGLFEAADESALFDEKVKKVAGMYPTVVSQIYRAVLDAEKEFVELATKLGKLTG